MSPRPRGDVIPCIVTPDLFRGLFSSYNTDAGTITHDETMFCLFTNYLIRNNVPQENWIDVLCKCVDFNDPVIRFNYSGLVYYAEAPKPKYNYDYWYRTMGFENTRWWG